MLNTIIVILILQQPLYNYTVKEVIDLFPNDINQKQQLIIDPKRYLSDTTKQKIYQHMQQILINKNFVGSRIILIIIDKYNLEEAWLKFIQRFVQGVYTKVFPNPLDRYNSFFAIYSIQDQEYQIRIGSKFAKIYQNEFAVANGQKVKDYLRKNQHQKAFEILYKNVNFCVNGYKEYCTEHYTFNKLTFSLLVITVLILQTVKLLLCLKNIIKEKLNSKYNKIYFSQEQMKKKKILNNFAQDECCVCMELFQNSLQHEQVFLKCGHNFHYKCIDVWLKKEGCCPLCKKTIIKEEINQQNMKKLDFRLELISSFLIVKKIFFEQNSEFALFFNMQWTNKIFILLAPLGNITEYFMSVGSSGNW